MKNKCYKFLSIIFFALFVCLFIISLLIIFGYFKDDFDKLFITIYFSITFLTLGIYYFSKYLIIPLKFIEYESQYTDFDKTFETIVSILEKNNFIKKNIFKKNKWHFEVFVQKGVKKRKSKCVSIIETSEFSRYNCELLINKIKSLYCDYCKKEKTTLGEWYLILIVDKYTFDLQDYIENLYMDFVGYISKNSSLLIDFIPVYIFLDEKNNFIKIPSFIKRKSKRKAGDFIVKMLDLKEKQINDNF